MKKLLLCAALVAGLAHAEFKDGNKLLAQLQGATLDQSNALGYITGVSDTMHGVGHCPPENATAGQLSDMVRNYLINVPAERHRTADVIVLYVLKTTWPCAERAAPRGKSL